MSLKFLLSTFEEDKGEPLSLAGLLQRERLRSKRLKKPRVISKNFRPSTLVWGYCKRQKVAQLGGLVDIYQKIPTPKEELNFDIGKSFHEIIQSYFWKVGLLEGWYSCIKCDHKWWSISPKECTSCNNYRTYLRYNEVPLVSENYGISGRADGILALPNKALLEIKSIQNRQLNSSPKQICYEDLVEPKYDNLVQINLYMMVLEIYEGHIMYVSRNTNQVKSYYVEHDAKIVQPFLDDITEIQLLAQKIRAKEPVILPEPCSSNKCACEEIVYV